MISFIDLKLWLLKVIKSDVHEWRVFAEPVTSKLHMYMHTCVCTLVALQLSYLQQHQSHVHEQSQFTCQLFMDVVLLIIVLQIAAELDNYIHFVFTYICFASQLLLITTLIEQSFCKSFCSELYILNVNYNDYACKKSNG